MTPVLNKLMTIQLLIQNKVECIVFDNEARGCYDIIIIGIALACLKLSSHAWTPMGAIRTAYINRIRGVR
jgi:hypothetical protein